MNYGLIEWEDDDSNEEHVHIMEFNMTEDIKGKMSFRLKLQDLLKTLRQEVSINDFNEKTNLGQFKFSKRIPLKLAASYNSSLIVFEKINSNFVPDFNELED